MKGYAKVVYLRVCVITRARILMNWNLPMKLPASIQISFIDLILEFIFYLLNNICILKRVKIFKNWNLPMKLPELSKISTVLFYFKLFYYILYNLQGIPRLYTFVSITYIPFANLPNALG